MIKLNKKEKEYIDLDLISGNNIGDRKLQNSMEIKPTYKIVDWLRAKNVAKGKPIIFERIDSNQDGFLDLTREVEFGPKGRTTTLDKYIESILVGEDVKVKGLDGPISHAFGK